MNREEYIEGKKKIVAETLKNVSYSPFGAGTVEVRVKNQIPNHVFESMADTLFEEGLVYQDFLTVGQVRDLFGKTTVLWIEDEDENCLEENENGSLSVNYDHYIVKLMYPMKFHSVGGAIGVVLQVSLEG